MFIELDDRLTSADLRESRIIDALENLAILLREGKHILHASLATARYFAEAAELSSRARGAYKYVQQMYSQQGSLKYELNYFITVVPAEESLSVKRINEWQIQLNVPIVKYADTSLIQETIVLGENILDAEFYNIIAQVYLSRVGLRLPLRMEKQLGGGSTLYQAYSEIQASESRLCICIVDSDRDAPEGKLGTTAKKIIETDDVDSGLCKILLTSV